MSGAENHSLRGLIKRLADVAKQRSGEIRRRGGDLSGYRTEGSGKTTLINMLTGHLFCMPDGGRRRPARPAKDGTGRTTSIAAIGRGANVSADAGIQTQDGLEKCFPFFFLFFFLVRGMDAPPSTRQAEVRRAREYLEFLTWLNSSSLHAKEFSRAASRIARARRCPDAGARNTVLDEPFAASNRIARRAIKRHPAT